MSLRRFGSKAPLLMALIAMAVPAAFAQTSGYFFTLPSTNSVATYTTGPGGALVAGPVVPVGGSGVFAATVDPTGHYLYVTALGSNQVFGFVIGTTGGLTAVAGSPFGAGTGPTYLTVDPTARFLYVANASSNDISSYQIGAGGVLNPIGSATPVGGSPGGLVVNSTGGILYGVNTTGNTTFGFTIGANGALSALAGAAQPTGTTPQAIARSANLLYIANSGSNNVSAFGIQPNGSLVPVSGQPFATQAGPTGIAADPQALFIYVANTGANTISKFFIAVDGSLIHVADLPIPNGPVGLVPDPTGNFLYVAAANAPAAISAVNVPTFTSLPAPTAPPAPPFQGATALLAQTVQFAVTAPATANVGTPVSVTVTATDASNNTVTGYAGTVQLSSTDTSAVVGANSTLTNGTKTFTVTFNTPGTYTITANDTVVLGLTGTSNTVTVIGPATHFNVSAPASATAGTAFNFTVTALDSANNTATGYTGTAHFTSADAQAVLPANSTLTNGVGTFSATLKTSGSQTITATDTVTASITGSTSVSVTGGAATHFTVSAPASTGAGSAASVTVTALDAFGNVATGYSGTVHFTSGDGQAVLPADSTLTNGVGTFSVTLKTAGSQTVTATDTVTGSITGSASVTVNPGAATHFTVSAPGTTSSNSSMSVTVTALDAFNNVATGYSGTVHFTSSDAQAVLPANSTLTNGAGSFSVTLKTVGSQSVTATDTVTASITGSANSTVTPGAGTTLVVSAPATAIAGTAFSFTVTARDASNNVATGYSGTVHFTSSDGQAVLPANSTLTNGTGTFSATLDTAGAQTLTATDTITSSITGAASVTVSAGAATHFSVSAPASAASGTAFNVTVTALDAFNNVATGYAGTVHFVSPDLTATLPANSTLTNGVGTFSVTLRAAGSQGVTVSDSVNGSITGSASITVSAANLTITTIPAGLTVVVDGVSVVTPALFNFVPASSHTVSVASPQAGTPGTQYRFGSWSDSQPASHSVVIPGLGTLALTANFVTQYQLIETANPSSGGSVAPGSGLFFDAGTTVTVSALATGSFRFTGWSGPVASASNPVTTVVMNAPVTIAANFGSTATPPEVTPTFLNLSTKPNDNTLPTGALSIRSDTPLTFTIATGVPWLTATPSSLTTPVTVTLRADPTGLTPGQFYNTVVLLTFSDGTRVSIPVQFFVSGTAQLSANPVALSFTAQAGSTATQRQTVNVTSTIGSVPVTPTVGSGTPWLTVSAGPVTPSTVQVQVSAAGLTPGTYNGTVTVSSSQASAPVTIAVTFTVTPAAPAIAVTSIANAASFASASGSPNLIVSALGTFPGCTSGAQVRVNGAAADVFFSSPTQINFLLPPAMSGDGSVVVTCGGATAAPVTLKGAAAQPALFTTNSSGSGTAAIVNHLGQVNGPASAGNYVELFGSGFGVLGTAGADGLRRLTGPVTATIGGVSVTVLYAGEAPGFTSGLQQINVMLPSDVTKGPAVPVVLNFGGLTSQPGVTLNIQ